jgi:hypothetical protein
MLRGLAVCGWCGASVYVAGVTGRKGKKYWYYQCSARKHARNTECRFSFPTRDLDDYAWDLFIIRLARQVKSRARAMAKAQGPDRDRAIQEAEAKVTELKKEEERLLRAARRASPETLDKVMAELAADLSAAKRALEHARLIPNRQPIEEVRASLALLTRAQGADPAQRREVIMEVIRPRGIALMPNGLIEWRD